MCSCATTPLNVERTAQGWVQRATFSHPDLHEEDVEELFPLSSPFAASTVARGSGAAVVTFSFTAALVLAAVPVISINPDEIEVDACHARSDDVPCLKVPFCGDGDSVVEQFFLTTAPFPDHTPPRQRTNASVCWNPQVVDFACTMHARLLIYCI